jgi:hypothetical protein
LATHFSQEIYIFPVKNELISLEKMKKFLEKNEVTKLALKQSYISCHNVQTYLLTYYKSIIYNVVISFVGSPVPPQWKIKGRKTKGKKGRKLIGVSSIYHYKLSSGRSLGKKLKTRVSYKILEKNALSNALHTCHENVI